MTIGNFSEERITDVAGVFCVQALSTPQFTKSEQRILNYYLSLNEERFCRSLLTIARATGVSKKTVERANERFAELGILSWLRGNGRPQANRYLLRSA